MGYKLTPRWLNDKAWISCSTPEVEGRNACHATTHPWLFSLTFNPHATVG